MFLCKTFVCPRHYSLRRMCIEQEPIFLTAFPHESEALIQTEKTVKSSTGFTVLLNHFRLYLPLYAAS